MYPNAPVGDHLFGGSDLEWAVNDPDVVLPQLLEAEAHAGPPVEVQVTTDPGVAQGIAMPSLRRTTTRLRPTWIIPFTGSAQLFLINPGNIAPEWPHGRIEDSELVLTYPGPSDDTALQRQYFDDQVVLIKTFLDALATKLDQ
jgi:hypothetical protein